MISPALQELLALEDKDKKGKKPTPAAPEQTTGTKEPYLERFHRLFPWFSTMFNRSAERDRDRKRKRRLEAQGSFRVAEQRRTMNISKNILKINEKL